MIHEKMNIYRAVQVVCLNLAPSWTGVAECPGWLL